jgi:hypothetical protein
MKRGAVYDIRYIIGLEGYQTKGKAKSYRFSAQGSAATQNPENCGSHLILLFRANL